VVPRGFAAEALIFVLHVNQAQTAQLELLRHSIFYVCTELLLEYEITNKILME
jgi:hypothetical protein